MHRTPCFDARWIGVLAIVLVAACGAESPAEQTPDAGADGTAPDSATSAKLASFRWTHGNGSESVDFTLTKDCALTAKQWEEAGPPAASSGVVGAEDCAAFASFVTSPAVLSSVDAKVRCDPSVSDDLTTIRIELEDGAVHERDASGCAITEPYRTIANDVATLRAKYARDVSDAGGDDGLSAEWCPPVSGACPSGCNAVYGRRYDATGKCLAPQELVTCSHGVDASTVSKCRVRTSTGELYRFDLMAPIEPGYPGWTACMPADETTVLDYALKSCP